MKLRSQITSKEKREEIILEYLTGGMDYRELGEKHQVKPTTIRTWISRYLNQGKVVSSRPDTKPVAEMSHKKKEAEEPSDVKLLKERIQELEMQNLALNTLIDVAERNGIEIRKKSGAKQ